MKCTILWTRDGSVVVATPKPCWPLVDYIKRTFGPERAKWKRKGTDLRAGPQWLLTDVTFDERLELKDVVRELFDEFYIEEVEDGAG